MITEFDVNWMRLDARREGLRSFCRVQSIIDCLGLGRADALDLLQFAYGGFLDCLYGTEMRKELLLVG